MRHKNKVRVNAYIDGLYAGIGLVNDALADYNKEFKVSIPKCKMKDIVNSKFGIEGFKDDGVRLRSACHFELRNNRKLRLTSNKPDDHLSVGHFKPKPNPFNFDFSFFHRVRRNR